MAVGDALPIHDLTDGPQGSVTVNGPVQAQGQLDLTGTSGVGVSAAGTNVDAYGSVTDPSVHVDVTSSSVQAL